jgi:hypothetical protein
MNRRAREANGREHPSVLKNPFVSSSDPCSEVQNPGSVVFGLNFLGVLGLFCAADRSDSNFFNTLRFSRKFAPGFGRWHHPYGGRGWAARVHSSKRVGKEKTVHKMRKARRVEQPPFGRQVAFARVATGLGWTGLGALAVGASAAGAVAIGALAIRALAVKRGRIQRLEIEELEVGRLHVRELVVEQERRPLVEQEQPSPQEGE